MALLGKTNPFPLGFPSPKLESLYADLPDILASLTAKDPEVISGPTLFSVILILVSFLNNASNILPANTLFDKFASKPFIAKLGTKPLLFTIFLKGAGLSFVCLLNSSKTFSVDAVGPAEE